MKDLRRLRDANDPVGFSRDLWKQMAELGWAGIVLPEELGGADLGYAELGLVLEECGRTLAATPFVSTVLLGANALLLAGNGTQQKDLLGAVAKGETILALALQEGRTTRPTRSPPAPRRRADGWQAHRQEDLRAGRPRRRPARSSSRAPRASPASATASGLFLVKKGARGLDVTRTTMVDGRNAAHVALDGVEVDKSACVGHAGRGADLLDAVLDRATIGLAAELLGTRRSRPSSAPSPT